MAPEHVPLSTLVPLLEAGMLAEEEELQKRWAALLANAAGKKQTIHPAYSTILRQLTSQEARTLDFFYDVVNSNPSDDKMKVGISKEKAYSRLGVTSEAYDLMMDNLLRLNILQPPVITADDRTVQAPWPFACFTYDALSFTKSGYEFVKACRFN